MIAWLLVACIEGRAPVDVQMYVQPSEPVVSLAGGQLTLTRAELTMADIRLESPPDIAFSPSMLSPFAAAYAHPGHDFAGSIRGELLGTWTVDLLGETTDLGLASGYEGEVLTGRIELRTLILEGSLVPDEGDPFEVALEIAVDRPVPGVAAEFHLEPDSEPLMVSVELDRILSFVDATDLRGTGADPVALDNALVFGLTTADAYTIRLTSL